MFTPANAQEALAYVWAEMDGKASEFLDERENGPDIRGHYEGYLADAEHMLDLLESRYDYALVTLE